MRQNLNKHGEPKGNASESSSEGESSDDDVPAPGGVDEKTKVSNDRSAKASNVASAKAGDTPVAKDTTWTIILLCTEPDSLMVRHNPFGDQCKIVEITEHDDFTSETGYQKVVDALRGPNVVIFASLPCTGGSPWQIPNKKHPACRRLIAKHHKLFNKLFEQLLRLYRDHNCYGKIPILFEWPRVCKY